jgi:hypothetical protein
MIGYKLFPIRRYEPCSYPEFRPKTSYIRKAYIFTMLLVVGRAIEAAAKLDSTVKDIFSQLPEGFCFCLGVGPKGPWLVARKDKKGCLRYLGWQKRAAKAHLSLTIKNVSSAMRVFTFQESTAQAFSYDRFQVEGSLPQALAFMRALDRVEVYLLPKIIAKLAVKRYPDSSELPVLKKHLNRILIYLMAFSPGLIRVIYKNI